MEVFLESCLLFIALLAHVRFNFMKSMLSGAPIENQIPTEMGGKCNSGCLEAIVIWHEQNALFFSLRRLGSP